MGWLALLLRLFHVAADADPPWPLGGQRTGVTGERQVCVSCGRNRWGLARSALPCTRARAISINLQMKAPAQVTPPPPRACLYVVVAGLDQETLDDDR
ncbi:hypothetical protein MTO96_002925 [Rhipicephalus appendiculatus]